MMRIKRAFVLAELLIVVIIIGLVSAVAVVCYKGVVERAKVNGAMSTMVEIGKAQSLHQITEGGYVSAANTEEIREALPVSLASKDYDYKIVDVTDDEFVVLAAEIDTGEVVLAMNQGGVFLKGPQLANYGSGSGGGGSEGSASGGGAGTSSGSGGGTSGGDAGGGRGSGSGDGSSTGTSAGSSGGGVPAIAPSAGGGWSDESSTGASEEYIEPDLLNAVHLLRDSDYASYAYDIITDKLITVAFSEFEEPYSTAGGVWTGLTGDPPNTIYVNTLTMQGVSDAAIAAVIAHEATHADYAYYGEFWQSTSLARHPELSGVNLSYPGNSVLQEFDCITNSCETWKELRTEPNDFNDAWLEAYEQGTAYFWAAVKKSYPALPDY